MTKSGFCIVTTTLATRKQALEMGAAIVKARLAACVQQWPIHSTYRWKGKIESGREFLLSCKTRTARATALQRFIRDHHPYEVPEIIATPVSGGLPAYLSWLRQETKGSD